MDVHLLFGDLSHLRSSLNILIPTQLVAFSVRTHVCETPDTLYPESVYCKCNLHSNIFTIEAKYISKLVLLLLW